MKNSLYCSRWLKCPRCGSQSLIRHGWQWQLSKTGPGHKVQRYRCNGCGRFTISPKRGL